MNQVIEPGAVPTSNSMQEGVQDEEQHSNFQNFEMNEMEESAIDMNDDQDYDMGQRDDSRSHAFSGGMGMIIDKEAVKQTLNHLKFNYKDIEMEIEHQNNAQQAVQQNRYEHIMSKITAVKQSLKSEQTNRKITEEQFYEIVDKKTKEIENQHQVKYINKMAEYHDKMKEFYVRQTNLGSKLVALNAQVNTKLSHKKDEIKEKIKTQENNFRSLAKTNVDADVSSLKQMGEYEYNFDMMKQSIRSDGDSELNGMLILIDKTVNDENVVCQKQEATKKLLIGQINFLKQKIKIEMESRRIADEDIATALDQFKVQIQNKVLEQRFDLKKRVIN